MYFFSRFAPLAAMHVDLGMVGLVFLPTVQTERCTLVRPGQHLALGSLGRLGPFSDSVDENAQRLLDRRNLADVIGTIVGHSIKVSCNEFLRRFESFEIAADPRRFRINLTAP